MGTNEVEQILRAIDTLREQRHENGIAATKLEGRVTAVETYIIDDKENNKIMSKHWRQLNLKMWMFIAGGIIGLIFMMLKDQII